MQSVFLYFVALRRAQRPFGGARAKKKTPPSVLLFFCSGPGERQGKEKPRWAPARGQSKKKTPRRVLFFFFCCGPARTLTHSLRAWVAMPRPGGATAKKNTPGGVFFFCCGPARTLTHSLRAWVAMPRPGGATAKKKTPRVVFFFFAAAPPGLFR